MNRVKQLALIAILAPLSAQAADFYVEDPSLVAPPPEVAVAIAASETEPVQGYRGEACRYLGKEVVLDERGNGKDWVVTTAPACAWAASAAPVWVVTRSPPSYKVVLSFVTYDLTIGKGESNGMHHIATGRGTASLLEEQLWKFDGARYKLIKNIVQDMSGQGAAR